ncbi:threonylcarbamoyl-AMP synthase [Algimonas ampicilliniresistens]|uniref:Threonylcarbamoyl-AMP synthase n=1 Tax=Algimonas ampicilliniresistens TaxID=1298735 RepID=A0ABQ5VCP0_9PROT|nr:L-threonylcarbamoyladenylate synthase [Algimonas ampicilliniresistens]GLQ24850.1 threonylcarbamoyl-AMP synthase [Algimonas ampicilliniresistens]
MTARIMTAGPDAYAHAAEILRAGGLVALPTETVYGLAGDARSDVAITAIYAAKGRPSNNPLITHVLKSGQAHDYAHISDLAVKLMQHFWPGPLTIVVPRRDSDLALRAASGLSTIALRNPDAPWVDGLCQAGWTGPLVMPSANLSGHVSPTTAAHVMHDLGERIDLIIDGGPCKKGVESTVIRVEETRAVLLRSGAIARADIETITGPLAEPDPAGPLASPGMLARHYAPEATLRLNATEALIGEILIGFGPDYGAPNLSEAGDLSEAARNLYRMIREFDGSGQKLAIVPIPETGLGVAINDRLRRAALGR